MFSFLNGGILNCSIVKHMYNYGYYLTIFERSDKQFDNSKRTLFNTKSRIV